MEVYRIRDDELYHHGIKGQKWGVRRYQNPDGSYTGAGKRRYIKTLNDLADKKGYYEYQRIKATKKSNLNRYGIGQGQILDKEIHPTEKKAQEWDTKRQEAENNIKKIDEAYKKTLKAAQFSGYNVTIKEAAKSKFYDKGKRLAMFYAGGVLPGSLYTSTIASNGGVQYIDRHTIKGDMHLDPGKVNKVSNSRNIKKRDKMNAYYEKQMQAGKVFNDAVKEAKEQRKKR